MNLLPRGCALRVLFLCALTGACTGRPVVGGLDIGDDIPVGPTDAADVPATPEVAIDTPDVEDVVDVPDVTDGPSRCTVDDDCRGNPAGAVCDTASGRCAQCATGRETCPDGRYCDTTSGNCLAGCRDDNACMRAVGDAGIDASVIPLATRCNTMTRACVECVDDSHCAAGNLCVGSVCVVGCTAMRPCPSTQTCCSGACVDPVSNLAHCGRCDNRCVAPNATAACMNGMCAVGTCTSPFADCDRDPANGCEANTLTAVAHCGACGMPCPPRPHARTSCSSGRCEFACDVGFGDCDGNPANGCESDLGVDETHCGTCETVCNPPNAVPSCVMGRCAVTMCAAGFGDCDSNATNGCETDINTAVAHCGRCASACPSRPNAFPGCLGGRCVTSCVMGFQDCDGVDANGCEADVRADATHCGSCGRACAPAHATGACAAGRCAVTRCEDGFADCDMDASNGCEVNTRSDPTHCAGCGMRCSTPGGTPACMTGRCDIAACMTGRADCDMTAANGCEVDLAADVRNCGACGTACALSNAVPVCAGGRCVIASCGTGFADCDTNPANGCETSLDTSAAHCGRCGNACSFPGSSAACERGMCRIATCAAGRGDCDGDSSNGCESTFATDPRNCGACGAACAVANGTAGCAAGRCAVASCDAGFADCDGVASNGCEVNTRSDPSHCAGCGARCVTPGATPACMSGRCDIARCDAGRADCDGVAANGCEVTLATDARNCGACGSSCSLPNATATCAAGVCAVGSCNAGFANCNGSPTDGCEVMLASDSSNCGACGTRCAPSNGTGVCASGTCAVVACNPGFANCNGNPADGCEANLASDPTRCGACTTRCSLANATAGCSSGRCAVASCNLGFADCNGNPSDGCEVNIAGDPAACGACGRACSLANVASAGCSGGVCTVSACVSGFGNCNGSAPDGCEVNLNTDPSNCRACGGRPAEACNLADDNCNSVCDDRDGCRTGVHRAYHASGEHFYTSSLPEASCCGFRLEFANFYYLYSSSAAGLVPFYRCLMDYGKHFYTTASNCETGRGVNEGILGYIAGTPVCGAVPLYRTYLPGNGDHFYTTSAAERDSALRSGYANEGVAGYVWASPRN